MKRQGDITVFLSLCLLSIAALLCVMTESARTAGSRFYFQTAVNGALDNLYSRYHRKMWQNYRILGLPCESEEEMEQYLEACVKNYLDVENWYPMELQSVEVSDRIRLTDQGGDYLTEEILAYMAFGIWDSLKISPEKGEQFLKDVTEAAGAGVMAGAYDHQEKEVRKLEKAAERIAECVKRQEQWGEAIARQLDGDNPHGFRKAAGQFRREENRMDSLIQAYERQAETLRKKLKDSRQKFEQVRQDFREDRGRLFEEQLNPYEAYISQDGTRRKEILEQQAAGQRNRRLLDQVEELVDELEAEYEARLEQDRLSDDSEGTAVLSLAPAGTLWRGYGRCRWSLDVNRGDRKKRNLLNQAEQLIQGRLVELVMPEGQTVSSGALPPGGPSHRLESSSGRRRNAAERVLVHEYCGYFFLNALSREKRPVQYEMEYLSQGRPSDRENLEAAVSRLFLIRQGWNLIHILSDREKRGEAKALAAVVTGVTGIAPLTEITACFIMGLWAAAEAVADLQAVLSGKTVPMWKTREDWQLSLESLLEFGAAGRPAAGPDRPSKGLTYGDYLKLLLFLTDMEDLQLRVLDLIEMNLQREEIDFKADNCVYQVDIQGKACGKHVFFALPFVENLTGQASGYPLEAPAERAY